MAVDLKRSSRLSNPLLASTTATKLSTSSLLTRNTSVVGGATTTQAPPTRQASITSTPLKSPSLLRTGTTTSSKLVGTGLSGRAGLHSSSLSLAKPVQLSSQSLLLSRGPLDMNTGAKERVGRGHDPGLDSPPLTRVLGGRTPPSSLLQTERSLRLSGPSPPSSLSHLTKRPLLTSPALSSRAPPGLSTAGSRLTSLTTSATRLTGSASSKLAPSKLQSLSSKPLSQVVERTKVAPPVTESRMTTRVVATKSLLSNTTAIPVDTPRSVTSASKDKPSGAEKRTRESERGPPRLETPVTAVRVRAREVDAPEYNFSSRPPKPASETQFLPPELDTSLQPSAGPTLDVTQTKVTLINAVATSLLSSPDFHSSADPTHRRLKRLGEKLACCDPEFLLKIVLYTRCDLNVRTTANFLLALAANLERCRPYVKKYFGACVRLPSDWIEVAEIYQTFHDKSIRFGALPTALRKVMGAKFAEFDAYQLAKYNKDSSKKKKKKPKAGDVKGALATGASVVPGICKAVELVPVKAAVSSSDSSDSSDSDSVVADSASESEEELQRMSFTLKQLVRKIHISAPVDHVMSLVGKRYPDNPEAFRRSHLSGTWDQDRAGKRMKLATPETWETQVSLKGNRASTWEALIDHNKLPFMAMLRNLRNLVIAGVSQKHHQWAIKKLNDERAVTNSRQFPFRFFSAYEVLGELEKIARGEVPVAKARKPGPARKGAPKKKPKKVKEPPKIDVQILQRYRSALDNALKISTSYNVKPISGSTVILCNVGSNMARPCHAARGLGKPRTVLEVGILLGLMCKYACESSTMIIYGPNLYAEVQLQEGTILKNMELVMTTAAEQGLTMNEGEIPSRYLQNMLFDRVAVDNLVLLTDTMQADTLEGKMVMSFLQKYRHLVNANLLFVSVDLSGRASGVSSTIQPEHKNDIYLAGYSDQILRFIAERGDSGQLVYVENIDKVYNLASVKVPALSGDDSAPASLAPEKALMAAAHLQKWRTIRVFISSTFRDMHGERDLLTRFVFPELRARARARQIQLYEVDLRWGVTEEETRSQKALEVCLSEVSRCQYFVGLLGERYGWVQDEYPAPDSPEHDWLREYPQGRSITELEMHHAALCEPERVAGKAFFYFRDHAPLEHVPPALRKDFDSESAEAKEKMESLKSHIRCSGLEVYDGYSCRWLGEVEGKLMLGGLEDFGQRVLHNLWNAIQRDYPEEMGGEDPIAQATALHEMFAESRAHGFVGRRALLRQLHEAVMAVEGGVVVVSGKPGSGKSAFLAAYAQFYMESPACGSPLLVLTHFVGAAPDSSNVASVLARLCHEMKRRFRLALPVPSDFTELARDFPQFLEESVASAGAGARLLVLIDGLDLLEEKHNARVMGWLPERLPPGVVVVVSGVAGGQCVSNVHRRQPVPAEVTVGAMDIFDKGEMVRRVLSRHRKALNETPFNNQLKLLLTKKEAVNPLFLLLACEELRVFGLFEEVTAFLKRMPSTVASLLQDVLLRLETEHGVELLSMALAMLCLVRNGLLEYELSSVLTSFFSSGGDAQVQMALPTMVTARLLRSLQTFLQPTAEDSSDRLSLAHKDIERAVRGRYMRGAASEKEKQFHQLLADYFTSEADPARNGNFEGNNGRAFSELPFHLMAAGAWRELEETLCSIHFVVAKCRLGLAGQLLEDYSPSALGLPTSRAKEVSRFAQQPSVQMFKSFVSRNLHVLASSPILALQQAVNEPSTSPIAQIARTVIQARPRPLMTWVNKPAEEDPCRLSLTAHAGAATSVAVSQDGALSAAGFENCSVKLFELASGREVHSFLGHAAGITCVCFVGSRAVCSASHDKTLSLWDVENGFRIATLKGHSRSVRGCAANPSGKTVASVSWDRTIKVWDGTSGKLLSTLRTPGLNNTPLNCVSFHPEGQLIAVGCWDASLRVWDTYNQKRLKILKGHRTAVQACTYAPSGRHIVSASLDGEVKIWSTKSGSAVGSIVGHSSPVNAIAFTPNGQFLATASSDQLLKIWSGSLGRPVRSVGAEPLGFAHCICFDTPSQTVRVGYHDGTVRKFCVQTGAEVFAVKPHAGAVVGVALWDKLNMSASADSSVKVWSPASLPQCIQLVGHKAPVTCAVWEKNGFASASEDFIILIWPHDVATYVRLGKTTGKKKNVSPNVAPLATFRGHKAKVSSIAFSTDGIRMVSTSHDHSAMVWDTLSQKHLQTLHACHKDWVTTSAFSDTSPDWLITGSSDFTLKLWDLKSGTEKITFKGHTSSVTSVAFSQGCVASAAVDGSVKVWTRKGVEITTLHCHQRRINQVLLDIPSKGSTSSSSWADIAAAEDESDEVKTSMKLESISVITASDDGTVGVWKPFLPNEVTTLVGHSDRVLSVMATTNNHILSGSRDGSVRVWTPKLEVGPRTGQLLERGCLGAHVGPVSACTIAPGGGCAISAGRDGHFMVWRIVLGGEEVRLEKIFSVKASEKALSAACITSINGKTKVATAVIGGDDGYVSTYRIVPTEFPTVDVTHGNLMGEYPISKLALSTDNKFVVASSWSSRITAITSNRKVSARMDLHTDWVMDIATTEENKTATVYSIGLDHTLHRWALPKQARQSVDVTSRDVSSYKLNLDPGEKKAWLLSVVDVGSHVALGDSEGRLTLWSKATTRVEQTRTVHRAAITALATMPGLLVTGSADSTVKVWSVGTAPLAVKQIGLFYGQSCVTALASVPRAGKNEPQLLLVGDSLGHVTLLQWHQ